MSGMLRVLPPDALIGKHGHVGIVLESTTGQRGRVLRFTDPRRFGNLLWQPIGEVHPLPAALGPEPLTDAIDGDTLWHASLWRSATVKLFLMDTGAACTATGSPSRIAFSRIESPITVTRQRNRLRH